jgi:beta-phosphoglucomutase-like phosphatase (HAD superfamily)
MNLPPAQVLVLEDGAVGVAAAQEGGFPVIGIGPKTIHKASVSLPSLAGVKLDDLLVLLN